MLYCDLESRVTNSLALIRNVGPRWLTRAPIRALWSDNKHPGVGHSGSKPVGVRRSKFKMGPNKIWIKRLLSLGGNKIVYILKMGGFWNEAQQDLNKMVDMVKFRGGKKIVQMPKMGAKPRRIPTDSQRGSALPGNKQRQTDQ